jgi:serine/threonine-protein kinase
VTKTTQPARVLAGRYELVERIGVGGMAEVWKGRDRRLNRDVAVKLLAGPAVRDPSRRRRIEREARTLAALSDPGVVAVYDYGEEQTDGGDVLPYLVMELVDGPDLHHYLREKGRLSPQESRQILRAIGAAIDTAHHAGVVHGDLKPANIFIDRNGPKVGDFGVARVLDEETGATTLAATPAFAAPEVLRGGKPTPASDVYSLACLAFEMLTGHPPYEGGNAWEVATKHLEAPIPSARVHRPDVDVQLDEAIRAGMQKDPRKRPRSASGLTEMLATAPAEPTRTIPVSSAAVVETPDATEALPSRPSTDELERAAVFGPFAGVARRARNHKPSRRGLFTAIAIGLLVPLFFLLIGMRSSTIAVPDVHGQTQVAATAALQKAGFAVSGVSYRPVTEGRAGIVVGTIPAAGTHLARGAKVHIIATALEAPDPTPAPEVTSAPDTTTAPMTREQAKKGIDQAKHAAERARHGHD